ncbi:MAG: bifunctional nuclease family protein [bacterium]|nr:bifunctional nuclease family protein [bacterium]
MAVEMKVKGLMVDPVSNMPIIVLKDSGGDSVLPIWVGIFEANAIAMQLENVISPRPMTHDLLKSVIESLSGEIRRVVITDLKDNTFFARIDLDSSGQSLEVDARPSDAMALALRAGAPIFVESGVLTKSAQPGEADSEQTERLRRWLETVDPNELGRYEM